MPATATTFKQELESLQNEVDQALDRYLPAEDSQPSRLHQAMRYAVIGGGKRVRPILVYASGRALGVPLTELHSPACAVELIHAYSLIHDDLPAMDDDDLRRGQPTCHKAFDEATAILAGDALQALAFEILVSNDHSAEQQLKMVKALAHAAGSCGMAGGQAIDLAAVDRQLNLAELENMHRHKTGALIEASVILGSYCSPGTSEQQRSQLRSYAEHIGLAFQIQDDILDVISDTDTLGKPQGADMAMNKPTYHSLLGLEGARAKLHDVHQKALSSLAEFDDKADLLRNIANYIVERTY